MILAWTKTILSLILSGPIETCLGKVEDIIIVILLAITLLLM